MSTSDASDLANGLMKSQACFETMTNTQPCIPECSVSCSNEQQPNVPCGLCDRTFHSKCLGLPEGTSVQFARGLYLCQECLHEIRDLLVRARHDRGVSVTSPVHEQVDTSLIEFSEMHSTDRDDQTKVGEYRVKQETCDVAHGNQSSDSMDHTEQSPVIFENVDGFNPTYTCPSDQLDDNYLYCDDCGRSHLGNCPIHGAMYRIQDSQVSELDPQRADHSLPPGLGIRLSSYPNAGLGVWADNDVPKNVVFGPFVGCLVATDSPTALSSDYCWQITGTAVPSKCIDGRDISKSNWMRYVNCAHDASRQNLIAFQYKGHIFYRSIKPIPNGTELLVYYGDEYAKLLGLRITQLVKQEDVDDTSAFAKSSTGDFGLDIGRLVMSPRHCHTSSSVRSIPGQCSADPLTSQQDTDDRDAFDIDYVICPQCPLGFSCSTLLQKHVRDVHRNTPRVKLVQPRQMQSGHTRLGVAPRGSGAVNSNLSVKCSHCGLRCSKIRYLKQHMTAKHPSLKLTGNHKVGVATSVSDDCSVASNGSRAADNSQKSVPAYKCVRQPSTKNSVVIRICRPSRSRYDPRACSLLARAERLTSHTETRQSGLAGSSKKIGGQTGGANNIRRQPSKDVKEEPCDDYQEKEWTPDINGRYTCCFCSRTFSRKNPFLRHVRTQHDERENGQLDLSTQAPGLRKRYGCHLCPTTYFSRTNHLKYHLRAIHRLTVTYKCVCCKLEFVKYIEARSHLSDSSHTGLKRVLTESASVLVPASTESERETAAPLVRSKRIKRPVQKLTL